MESNGSVNREEFMRLLRRVEWIEGRIRLLEQSQHKGQRNETGNTPTCESNPPTCDSNLPTPASRILSTETQIPMEMPSGVKTS